MFEDIMSRKRPQFNGKHEFTFPITPQATVRINIKEQQSHKVPKTREDPGGRQRVQTHRSQGSRSNQN